MAYPRAKVKLIEQTSLLYGYECTNCSKVHEIITYIVENQGLDLFQGMLCRCNHRLDFTGDLEEVKQQDQGDMVKAVRVMHDDTQAMHQCPKCPATVTVPKEFIQAECGGCKVTLKLDPVKDKRKEDPACIPTGELVYKGEYYNTHKCPLCKSHTGTRNNRTEVQCNRCNVPLKLKVAPDIEEKESSIGDLGVIGIDLAEGEDKSCTITVDRVKPGTRRIYTGKYIGPAFKPGHSRFECPECLEVWDYGAEYSMHPCRSCNTHLDLSERLTVVPFGRRNIKCEVDASYLIDGKTIDSKDFATPSDKDTQHYKDWQVELSKPAPEPIPEPENPMSALFERINKLCLNEK